MPTAESELASDCVQATRSSDIVHEDTSTVGYDYSEGDVFPSIGRKVSELIMKSTRYIVFLDECGSVQWAHDRLEGIGKDDYDAVCNKVAELEVRSRFLMDENPGSVSKWSKREMQAPSSSDAPIQPWDRRAPLFSARRLVAEGIARLLDSNSKTAALGVLETAERWIACKSDETSRKWFLTPFAVMAMAAFGGALYMITQTSVAAISGPAGDAPANTFWEFYTLLLACALLGGTGSFVSASVLNRRIPFDATAGRQLHQLEALVRFCVGLIGGTLTLLLIKSGILFSGLAKEGTNAALCLVLGFLAGASELFFPTLLRKFDGSLGGEGK